MLLEYNPDDWTVEKIKALPVEQQDQLAAARVRQMAQRARPVITFARHPDGSTSRGWGDSLRRDRTSHMLTEVRGPSPTALVIRRAGSNGRRGRGRF